MLSIKFDFHCTELWHIEVFERAVKKMIKGDYTLIRDQRRAFDPIVQNYQFITQRHIHFFELGMVMAIVYESVQNGSIVKNFTPEAELSGTYTEYEIVPTT